MKRLGLLCAALALSSFAIGCGDDDSSGTTDSGTPPTDGPAGDAPVMVSCPMTAPDMGAGMMGACCYRESNASRTDAPEFRIAALNIESPASLSSAIINGALKSYLDAELFNWLVDVTGADADGEVTVKTGYGQRNADGTFVFCETGVAAPCDPAAWAPASVMGNIMGETLTSPPANAVVTVPIFSSEDPTMVTLELPLYSLELTNAALTEMRSCIGTRRATSYATTDGALRTFIRVEDAKMGHVEIGTTINTSLCMLIAGMSTVMGDCDTIDQATWMVKPDSLCDMTGSCTANTPGMTDACDPNTTCNAWLVTGEFAAHGVQIVD